jgi:endonuclease YncB( thermonuclease family)
LIRVIDGSQIVVRVVFAPGQHKDATIKLKGIDVPKLTVSCPQERALARKASALGENILQKNIALRTSRNRR